MNVDRCMTFGEREKMGASVHIWRYKGLTVVQEQSCRGTMGREVEDPTKPVFVPSCSSTSGSTVLSRKRMSGSYDSTVARELS